MPLSLRMLELQSAMDRYGEATVKHLKTIHSFGDAVLLRLTEFLGDGSSVIGVPPVEEFSVNRGDYNDAKFSTYYNKVLSLKPIQMGIAIGIPHSKDDGIYWPRVVVEFEMIGDALSVKVGDDIAMRGFPLEPGSADLDRVCAAIFEYTKIVLENPVRTATAVSSGKFGFI